MFTNIVLCTDGIVALRSVGWGCGGGTPQASMLHQSQNFLACAAARKLGTFEDGTRISASAVGIVWMFAQGKPTVDLNAPCEGYAIKARPMQQVCKSGVQPVT